MNTTRKSNRKLWILVIVMSIIAISAGSYALALRTSQRNDAFDQAATAKTGEKKAKATTQAVGATGKDLADQVLAACAGTGREAKALRAAELCGQATETKTTITKATPGATGATGPRGPGPTLLQVIDAVRLLIDDALAANCGGTCEGKPGANGKDSTVPGPKGDSAQDGKEGPQGPVGPAGEKGDKGDTGNAGRGIVSGPECDDDGNLVTHFDQEPLVESHPAPACKPLVDLP